MDNQGQNHIHYPQGTIRQIKTTSRRRRDGLIQHAYDNTSQSGEDGIIEYLFSKIPPTITTCTDANETNNTNDNVKNVRWLVDVGAWDGVHLSNTYSLLIPQSKSNFKKKGKKNDSPCSSATICNQSTNNKNSTKWKGILIEADQEKFKQLSTLHETNGNVCHNITVSCQPWSTSSLAQILASSNHHSKTTASTSSSSLPNTFDFLCIDVDGTDYWLLYNILHDTKYRPKVICIEFNPTIPHSILFIPPRDDLTRQGCSLTALIELTSLFNYQLVETTCYNAFFVPKPLFEAYLQSDLPFVPDIDNVHEITMGTNLYQLYDGTIKLAGCQKMLWHRLPIREEDIQIIQRKDRNFPFAPLPQNDGNDNDIRNMNEKSDNVDTKIVSQIIDEKEELLMYRHLAIDMSSYCKHDTATSLDERLTCSSAIYDQLQKDGFALVRGTGIPSRICQQALQNTNLLLNDADENVRRSCLTKDRARRGYSPQNSENFASLVGEKKSNDLVRKFRVGPNFKTSAAINASSALHQPNAWPTEDAWGEEHAKQFRSCIETFYDHVCQVSNAIVRAICDGINNNCQGSNILLPSSLINNNFVATEAGEDIEQSYAKKNTSILTLLGYRKGARHQGKHTNPLIAAHTDVGVITVLLFDGGDCATLQRHQLQSGNENSSFRWVDVKLPSKLPEDPIFVVNIGDCLSDMCDGALPSTLHRVMPNKGGMKPRNCLALFMGLNHNELLRLPNGEEITYEEWRRRRIARARQALKCQSTDD
jgi:isopenicillin N synthase-like dioxygenase